MPHCVVEHSADIEGRVLTSLVHQGALASGLFEAEGSDIKVRALPYTNYITGSVDISFVHVTVKILSGRSAEQKSALSQLVLDQLRSASMVNCSLSVEVADIDRGSYVKDVI